VAASGRYRVLILAGCTALSDHQIGQIRRYAKSGGRICVIGPAATHDEWMMPRKESALGDFSSKCVVRSPANGDILDSIRQACADRLSLSIKAELPESEGPRAAVGEPVYADRDYVITRMPEELAGVNTIRFSASSSKQDSSLRLRAAVPERVFIAFAPRGFSDQWLDPQPNWRLYKAAGLDTTIVQIGKGMDIYCRDFDAGDVRLFEGKSGAYVLLGIKAQSPDFEGEAFAAEPKQDAPLGLCCELTEQSDRRLVHLVNYRSDGPVKDIAVCLLMPEGRKVKAVTLASPQRKDDLALPFEDEAGFVTFTVPAVDIYEIAIIALE